MSFVPRLKVNPPENMKMPQMDGVTFLCEIKKKDLNTIRIKVDDIVKSPTDGYVKNFIYKAWRSAKREDIRVIC